MFSCVSSSDFRYPIFKCIDLQKANDEKSMSKLKRFAWILEHKNIVFVFG